MTNSTRDRISAAFEQELATSPVPPGLRSQAVRAAVSQPHHAAREPRPGLLALVAVVLAVALVATLVIGSHVFRSSPIPARPYSSVPPAPRSGASLVYDEKRAELVLFGGSDVHGKVVNETWTWDGKGWRFERPKMAPAPRDRAVMAYDSARHEVVLFGGMAQIAGSGKGGQTPAVDTWVWDGATWKEQHPFHIPDVGFDWPPSMQFDPISQTLLMYGFTKSTSEGFTNMKPETWEWNGLDWIQRNPPSTPQQSGKMFGDGRHTYLIAGGPARVSQLWQWDGTTWDLIRSATGSIVGVPSSAAFDQSHGQLVVLTGDTWTWDLPSGWVRQHPQTQPPDAGYMEYFAPLQRVISWGSLWSNWNNDLWAWDGSNWKLLQAGNMPPLPSPTGVLGPTAPEQAAAFIRSTVTASTPVLLPSWLPAGLEARTTATADGFSVDYLSDQRDKTITLGIIVANPPPGDDKSSDTRVRFRNAVASKGASSGYAEYFVYDASAPTSTRWLMWIEPGTMANPLLKGPGVPYFLSADGLTDAEFWQVANSLQ